MKQVCLLFFLIQGRLGVGQWQVDSKVLAVQFISPFPSVHPLPVFHTLSPILFFLFPW